MTWTLRGSCTCIRSYCYFLMMEGGLLSLHTVCFPNSPPSRPQRRAHICGVSVTEKKLHAQARVHARGFLISVTLVMYSQVTSWLKKKKKHRSWVSPNWAQQVLKWPSRGAVTIPPPWVDRSTSPPRQPMLSGAFFGERHPITETSKQLSLAWWSGPPPPAPLFPAYVWHQHSRASGN